MYLLGPFILENLKKSSLGQSRVMRMCYFRGPKWFIWHEGNVFGTNHYYYFHLPTGPFHCAKFKKILTADPELWGCAIFGTKLVHLHQTFSFLENY